MFKQRIALVALAGLGFLGLSAQSASADTVPLMTFAPGQYDNTPNTTANVPVYKQTTGNFRDVFWWRSDAAGNVLTPTADYISSGKNLVLCGISACDNGTGTNDALNFTGPSTSSGQSYLALYDTTPADGATTKNTFNAVGGLTVQADVLFAANHASSGGVVALYNEGQDALALLANNAGNTDGGMLKLVFQSGGQGFTLGSVVPTSPTGAIATGNWYRLTLNISVTGGNVTATGTINAHTVGTNPGSALGALLATLNFTGSLGDPDAGLGNAFVLTNPGEVGVMAMARESISGWGCPGVGGSGFIPGGSDGCDDNVGVSITNFTASTSVPEPGSFVLMGMGLLSLAWMAKRR